MLRTYQTKIKSNLDYLNEVASFFGMIERKLFLDICIKNKTRNDCKKEYIRLYQITARQFNSIYIVLDGKIKSIIEKNKNQISYLKDKINSVNNYIKKKATTKIRLHKEIMKLEAIDKTKFIKKVNKYRKIKFILHNKKRLLYRLTCKLERLEKELEENKIRICFGSR